MASRAFSSGRKHFEQPALDQYLEGHNADRPLASADFGAETGAYFLKTSSPLFVQPYDVDSGPRPSTLDDHSCPTIASTHTTGRRKKRQRKREKPSTIANNEPGLDQPATTGAQVQTSACLGPLQWRTLPGCVISSTVDTVRDLVARPSSFVDTLTKNNRPIYLGILAALLVFLYRLLK